MRLQALFNTTRVSLRSYDAIARMGGDEFLCVMEDALPEDSQRRLRDVQATIAASDAGASFSVGFAALRPEDTLGTLMEGDEALYKAKRTRAAARYDRVNPAD